MVSLFASTSLKAFIILALMSVLRSVTVLSEVDLTGKAFDVGCPSTRQSRARGLSAIMLRSIDEKGVKAGKEGYG